ncbi:MAG TPA: aminoglycoside phosphotransferase family protein [Pyrinomonadaceae bacterium]|nr:aminoglycoside phosphotransferase family protein [Pyrinomonadaceae bacterium]
MNSENNASEKEIGEFREMARHLTAHHFGSKPGRIIFKSSGLTNFVFAVKHSEGDYIIRISPDATKINAFIKEQWAESAAREVGVPTAEILEVGNEVVPHPYMIVREIKGEEATNHLNRLNVVREIGRYAALINSIPTSGFGNTFDWSSNLLSRNETFAEYLQNALQVEAKLQTLEKYKMISAEKIKKLQKIFKEAMKLEPKPALNHSDMRLKNMIVNEKGEIKAVIDWENCTSNIAPQWELSIALHDLGIDEKQMFLESYGISEKKLAEISPLIKAFNIINYTPTIEEMAQNKDKSGLEQYRTRLGGTLDLYSL